MRCDKWALWDLCTRLAVGESPEGTHGPGRIEMHKQINSEVVMNDLCHAIHSTQLERTST